MQKNMIYFMNLLNEAYVPFCASGIALHKYEP